MQKVFHELNIAELLEDMFWFDKEGTYYLSENWETTSENPSTYKAFEWREIHSFQMLSMQFFVELREMKQERIFKNMIKDFDAPYSKRFSVCIGVAEASYPFSIERWQKDGGPWKNFDLYMNCYYGGELYKKEFKYDMNSNGTHSSLLEGFDDSNEAKLFVEEWKTKLLNDHSQALTQNKQIFEHIRKKCPVFV